MFICFLCQWGIYKIANICKHLQSFGEKYRGPKFILYLSNTLPLRYSFLYTPKNMKPANRDETAELLTIKLLEVRVPLHFLASSLHLEPQLIIKQSLSTLQDLFLSYKNCGNSFCSNTAKSISIALAIRTPSLFRTYCDKIMCIK